MALKNTKVHLLELLPSSALVASVVPQNMCGALSIRFSCRDAATARGIPEAVSSGHRCRNAWVRDPNL